MKETHETIVDIDFNKKAISKLAGKLRPVVFKDDHIYCCLLGSSLKDGVKGFGHTPEEAIEDWEASLRKRMEKPVEHDKAVQYALNLLSGKEQAYSA